MGRGRGFGDEAVDAVGQQLDLELLGVDFLLRPLVGGGGEGEEKIKKLQLICLKNQTKQKVSISPCKIQGT